MSSLPFKILGISHIGIAPSDSARLVSFLSEILKLPLAPTELIESQRTLVTMVTPSHNTAFPQASSHIGHLEILDNQEGFDGPIKKFVAKKGGGIHHIALAVDNTQAVCDYLKSRNIQLIDNQPRIGQGCRKVIFVHPHSTGGVLIEFVEVMPQ